MSEFTDGPWEAEDCYVETKYDQVARCYDHSGDEWWTNYPTSLDEAEANARLIAQSPAAYALLKRLEWEGVDQDGNYCLECSSWKRKGHADNCALANYFKAVEGT